jgi:hypothetical protein
MPSKKWMKPSAKCGWPFRAHKVRLPEYQVVQNDRTRSLNVRICLGLKKCLIMNIFQKIREVKLPFLAVIGALVFGGIVAPASAAGTSVTAADIINTTVNRGTTTSSANSITVTATMASGETLGGAYAFTTLSDAQHQFTLQANDSIKVVATYTNLTSGTNATSISMGYTSWYGYQQGQNTSISGSNGTTVNGSANTASKTAALTNLTAGTYDAINLNSNMNVTDAAVAAGDQVRIVYEYYLVRGGVESAFNLVTGQNNARGEIRIRKSVSDDHTVTSADTSLYSSANFCVFNNENGVTAGTQIEVTASSTGTLAAQMTDVYLTNNGSPIQASNGIYTVTMPSGSWTSQGIGVFIQAYNLSTVGQTWAPTVSAVIAGTSTNVLDRCNRQQVTPPAPAQVTASVRPLPQINFAANPVNGVSARPTADTRKGTLTIEGSNLSDLTSITIGGKAATFTVKDGKLDIKLPAGVTGFPEVVMTNASGSITMQNAIEIYAPTVQKLTKFVGERLTLAGMEVLENLYINNKTATALEATVVVAPDATEAEIAKAVAAATKAVTYIDKVGKRIVRTAVTVSKTGEAGTKPAIEMSFTK